MIEWDCWFSIFFFSEVKWIVNTLIHGKQMYCFNHSNKVLYSFFLMIFINKKKLFFFCSILFIALDETKNNTSSHPILNTIICFLNFHQYSDSLFTFSNIWESSQRHKSTGIGNRQYNFHYLLLNNTLFLLNPRRLELELKIYNYSYANRRDP